MGAANNHKYGEFIGEEKPGETRVLRNPDFTDKPLTTEPLPGINTIWKAFENSVKTGGDRKFLGTRRQEGKDFKEYQWKTYNDVNMIVREICNGYSNLGLTPVVETKSDGNFKFLGIYSKNNENFVFADLACHLNSITVVTIYDSLGDHTIEYIIDQTTLTSMCVESANLSKLTKLRKENKAVSLQNIILFDQINEKAITEAKEAGFNVITIEDLRKAGRDKENTFEPATPKTIATFCYTSGTTGTPKGAMISHGAILADISCLSNSGLKIFNTDVHLSYLPLAHVMERVVFVALACFGCAVGFFTGNPANLIKDAQALKPTIFVGVPKIFMRVYDVINEGINKLGYVKKSLAQKAISSKLYYYKKNGALTHPVWDRLVCNKFKSSLGGNVRMLMTGSAPISQDTLNFIKVCFSAPVYEGYGQTENCAAGTLTSNLDYIGGNVGGPISAVEIKLVDAPSLNYFSTDKDEEGNSRPRGEICFRGPILFSGYFNAEDKTKEALDSDGWLHTGDVGAILPNNSIKIIDRIKNIFKLAQGEYIAPEKLENLYVKGKYVEQIFVHGESTESSLVAIIYPKKAQVAGYLENIGIKTTHDDVHNHFSNEELKKEVMKDLEQMGRKNDFKGFEIIRNVLLINDPFTIENDLLTPTMKLKRHEAKKKYTDEIKKLYSK